jgi:tetratricopeptide (TPR) repeat protein
MLKKLKLFTSVLLVAFAMPLYASTVDSNVAEFKQQWAHIKYEVPSAQKLAAMEALVKRGEYLLSQFPASASMALWQGTALSTQASLKGGVKALGMAKKAKKHLETSLSMDPRAEQGQAHVILGALYSKIPGKPLGFGDKNKAQYHLQTAMSMNPKNLDAYYFYGEHLSKQGQMAEAKQVFEKGLKVAVNSDFVVADQGRRQEVQAALNSMA